MRFIWITHWSHGAFLKKKRAFQKFTEKINRNDNEGVYGKMFS